MPSAAASPIPRRKLAHQVLDRLLAEIRAGEFPTGAWLPSERDLMQRFGVGRPAVREALQSLERMGFITIIHGEGAQVQALTTESVLAPWTEAVIQLLSDNQMLLEHLLEARIAFEVAMARLACGQADPESLAPLQAALQAHLQAHQATDKEPQAFLKTDLAFHSAIAALSGNAVYGAISQAMLTWLARFHVDLVRAPGAEAITCQEHERIFEAIASGDPDAAAQAMSLHLRRAHASYRRDGAQGPTPSSGAQP